MTTPLSHVEHKATAILMFVAALVFSFPESSLAASPALTGNQSLVFELKQNALKENQAGLSMEEVSRNDELVTAVRLYLESKQSPLAPYAHLIVKEPNWQQALAITFVESNFCRKAANMNCGSVGVGPSHPSWRKFENHFNGFQAVTKLLDKPLYKDKYNTCKKKLGVYVVPGSPNWLRGCEKVEQEMHNLVTEAETKQYMKIAVHQPQNSLAHKELALAQ